MVLVFGSAAKETDPLPPAAAVEAIFNHVAPLAAVQAQPVPAASVTVPCPPAAGIENCFDDTA